LALKLNIKNKEERPGAGVDDSRPGDSAVEELPDGLLRAGYRHRAAPDLSQPLTDYSVGAGSYYLCGGFHLQKKISEFSTRRSAMAVAMVVL